MIAFEVLRHLLAHPIVLLIILLVVLVLIGFTRAAGRDIDAGEPPGGGAA